MLFRVLKILRFYKIFIALFCISLKCHIISGIFVTTESIPPSPNNLCQDLRDGFRFDFGFNQLIKHQSRQTYYHYIVSDNKIFLLFIPNKQTLKPARVKVNAGKDFESLKYDLGFSMPYPKDNDEITLYCTLSLLTFDLTCLQMFHNNLRNFESPFPFRTNETIKFRLTPDFLPSVVFQPVEFEDYSSTEYVYIFLEQKLIRNLQTKKWTYARRYQAYNFRNLNNILNYTASIELPAYFKRLPDVLEITGIFHWRESTKSRRMITAFDGSEHLFCFDEECLNRANYKRFLQGCNSSHVKRKDDRPLLMIDQWSKFQANPEREELTNFVTESEALEQRDEFVKTVSIIFNSVMVLMGIIIAVLVLSIVYYSIKETIDGSRRIKELENESLQVRSSTETLTSSNGSSISALLLNKVTNENEHPL